MNSQTRGISIHMSATPRKRRKDSLLSPAKRARSVALAPRPCTASTLSMPSSIVPVVSEPATRAAWPRRRTREENRLVPITTPKNSVMDSQNTSGTLG